MDAIRIRGGHKFRVKFAPDRAISTLPAPKRVALSMRGFDSVKPKVLVKDGDRVKLGQTLFVDKKNRAVAFTAPASGTVAEVKYGERRKLIGVLIDVDGSEAVDFGATARGDIAALGKDKVIEKLLTSGLWVRLQTFPGWTVPPQPGWRPEPDVHGHVAEPPSIRALYVSAVSTEPHLPEPLVALEGNEELFAAGLEALKQIAPKTWLFSKVGEKLPEKAAAVTGVQHRVIVDKFPAENIGLQAYSTERLKKGEIAIGASVEDVIDVGHLFLKGKLRTERTYAIAGKAAKDRKHVKGHIGLPVSSIAGEVSGDVRFIAGGLFTGTKVAADEYMGVHDRALQVLPEDRERTPFVFQRLGLNRFTLSRMWFSGFFPNVEREATTSNNGEHRACVQCSACIDICPVDLQPVLIMKAVDAGDIENMERLAIRDCIDCGLCTFVCPSKIEIAQHLDDGKALIAKEG
jgi:Na+-transporting NADH:ubiquinone oxidoreductase subunit A